MTYFVFLSGDRARIIARGHSYPSGDWATKSNCLVGKLPHSVGYIPRSYMDMYGVYACKDCYLLYSKPRGDFYMVHSNPVHTK